MPYATTWVHPEIIHSEVSQTEKDKYHVISLVCGIWKKKRYKSNCFTAAQYSAM